MKKVILSLLCIFFLLFESIAVRAQEIEESQDTVRRDSTENKAYRQTFTLDPMGNTSTVPEDNLQENTEEVRPEETKHYTISVEPDTVIAAPRHNPNDDIHTLSKGARHQGGYGGLSFKFTQFDDKYVALAGIRAGWIIDRAVAIGIDAYGVIPSTEYSGVDPFSDTRLVGGYGGLNIEPILFSNKVIHVTFPVSGGAGWLGYVYDWEEDDYEYHDDDLVDGDVFWYVEPAVAMELNITKFLRMNMGASYRFAQDFEVVNTPSDAFNGWGYFVTFKLGRF